MNQTPYPSDIDKRALILLRDNPSWETADAYRYLAEQAEYKGEVMAETPNSALMFVSNERLREIVDCGRMWCGDRETQLLAAEVIRCRASLPPQAAVGEGDLPKRPDLLLNNCTKMHIKAAWQQWANQMEIKYGEAIAQRDEANEARERSEREYKELDRNTVSIAAVSEIVTAAREWQDRAIAAEAKLAATETERDEARKSEKRVETFLMHERAIWCDKPEDRMYHAADNSWWMRGPDGSPKRADAPAAALDVPKSASPQGAPDFNKWWHGDNSAKWSSDGKERRNWKPLFESTWKAALAALDVPKPRAKGFEEWAAICGLPESQWEWPRRAWRDALASMDVPKPEEIERLLEEIVYHLYDKQDISRITDMARPMFSRLRSLPNEPEIEGLYFIQDTRTTCGNAVMWWKPDGNGYTSNVNEAWRVPKEKADQMHRNRSTDVAWPVSVILGKAFPIFDFQNLRSIEKDK
jgi:hypothetical protein